jgi:hypothetical protein
MTPLVRLLVFALCAGAGFLGARPFTSSSPRTAAPTPLPAAPPTVSIGLPPLTAAESALIGEWENLREQHGGAGGDLSAVYLEVKDIKDPFRRRAFRAALIAEWTTTNPLAALAFLTERDSGSIGQFVREWLRLDPQAAISGMLASDEKTRANLRGVLNEIATLAPARLAEVVAALPKSESRWDTTAQDAFALMAQKDPAAARAAAESLNGPLRGQALAGVAKAWAEKDGPGALVWAQAMAPGEARDAALKAVLVGWAKTDPVAALGKIDLVPPGGEDMYFASDVGAQVLREAATRDWDTTLTWLRDHPGKLGAQSLNGMVNVLSHRLGVDVAGTMRSLLQSGVAGLSQALGNSLLNEGYAQHDAVWQWLDQQPANDFTKGVRSSLLNAMAWKEPDTALAYLDKLPFTDENRPLLQQGVSSLLNGGSQMDRFEDLLAKISPNLRPLLLESGFNYGVGNGYVDPAKWIPRLNELPAEQRVNAVGSLARGWASSDPQGAIEWASSLTDPAQRDQALGSAIGSWAQSDIYESTQWVNKLPAGKTRDMATQNIVGALINTAPEDAWTWALSVTTPDNRRNALQMAYMGLTRKDPAIAKQLLQDAHLSDGEASALQKQFGGGITPLR